MKRLSTSIVAGITLVALIAFLLTGWTSASAATLPERIRHNGACGVWNAVSSPNVGTSSSVMSGIAAISANNVWAVGSYSNGNGGLTLVEHWNGTKWIMIASPNVNGSKSDSLSGVVAIAANNIWAVGSYSNASNNGQTLIEHWNGTSWSIVSSPNVASLSDGLSAVSAVSATDIWAIGAISGNTSSQPLIEHWNGASWSINSSTGTGQALNGVAAIASNNVWAVGSVLSSPSLVQTLIEHWNGSTWSVVPSSGPGPLFNILNSIAAISANNIWAVGDDTNSPAPSAEYAPLVEHWNGTTWSVVASTVAGTSDRVNAIAAVSANNIWAMGDDRTSLDPNGPYFTLIEHWNGANWSVVNSPSPGSMVSDLTAAARIPATHKVWAVGFTQDSISQTLTEFRC
jgi:hypothetical protein